MAQLAIKGHATRGKEVIEILEMLGGKNTFLHYGDNSRSVYYIDKSNRDYISRSYTKEDCDCVIFTIEEFLEKFPYKVGDKVYNIVHNENQTITDLAWGFQENEVVYKTNNNEYVYVNYLQPYKEETMENKLGQITLDIPDGYEFYGINDDNKVVLTKIQPKYPKTYEKCCNVLGVNPSFDIRMLEDEESTLYFKFIDLVRCRNAYWKIAGDWKPDWNDNSKFKYVITCKSCNIIMYSYCTLNCILAFPTQEMRDAFYENFKELIEECKEFL